MLPISALSEVRNAMDEGVGIYGIFGTGDVVRQIDQFLTGFSSRTAAGDGILEFSLNDKASKWFGIFSNNDGVNYYREYAATPNGYELRGGIQKVTDANWASFFTKAKYENYSIGRDVRTGELGVYRSGIDISQPLDAQMIRGASFSPTGHLVFSGNYNSSALSFIGGSGMRYEFYCDPVQGSSTLSVVNDSALTLQRWSTAMTRAAAKTYFFFQSTVSETYTSLKEERGRAFANCQAALAIAWVVVAAFAVSGVLSMAGTAVSQATVIVAAQTKILAGAITSLKVANVAFGVYGVFSIVTGAYAADQYEKNLAAGMEWQEAARKAGQMDGTASSLSWFQEMAFNIGMWQSLTAFGASLGVALGGAGKLAEVGANLKGWAFVRSWVMTTLKNTVLNPIHLAGTMVQMGATLSYTLRVAGMIVPSVGNVDSLALKLRDGGWSYGRGGLRGVWDGFKRDMLLMVASVQSQTGIEAMAANFASPQHWFFTLAFTFAAIVPQAVQGGFGWVGAKIGSVFAKPAAAVGQILGSTGIGSLFGAGSAIFAFSAGSVLIRSFWQNFGKGLFEEAVKEPLLGKLFLGFLGSDTQEFAVELLDMADGRYNAHFTASRAQFVTAVHSAHARMTEIAKTREGAAFFATPEGRTVQTNIRAAETALVLAAENYEAAGKAVMEALAAIQGLQGAQGAARDVLGAMSALRVLHANAIQDLTVLENAIKEGVNNALYREFGIEGLRMAADAVKSSPFMVVGDLSAAGTGAVRSLILNAGIRSYSVFGEKLFDIWLSKSQTQSAPAFAGIENFSDFLTRFGGMKATTARVIAGMEQSKLRQFSQRLMLSSPELVSGVKGEQKANEDFIRNVYGSIMMQQLDAGDDGVRNNLIALGFSENVPTAYTELAANVKDRFRSLLSEFAATATGEAVTFLMMGAQSEADILKLPALAETLGIGEKAGRYLMDKASSSPAMAKAVSEALIENAGSFDLAELGKPVSAQKQMFELALTIRSSANLSKGLGLLGRFLGIRGIVESLTAEGVTVTPEMQARLSDAIMGMMGRFQSVTSLREMRLSVKFAVANTAGVDGKQARAVLEKLGVMSGRKGLAKDQMNGVLNALEVMSASDLVFFRQSLDPSFKGTGVFSFGSDEFVNLLVGAALLTVNHIQQQTDADPQKVQDILVALISGRTKVGIFTENMAGLETMSENELRSEARRVVTEHFVKWQERRHSGEEAALQAYFEANPGALREDDGYAGYVVARDALRHTLNFVLDTANWQRQLDNWTFDSLYTEEEIRGFLADSRDPERRAAIINAAMERIRQSMVSTLQAKIAEGRKILLARNDTVVPSALEAQKAVANLESQMKTLQAELEQARNIPFLTEEQPVWMTAEDIALARDTHEAIVKGREADIQRRLGAIASEMEQAGKEYTAVSQEREKAMAVIKTSREAVEALEMPFAAEAIREAAGHIMTLQQRIAENTASRIQARIDADPSLASQFASPEKIRMDMESWLAELARSVNRVMVGGELIRSAVADADRIEDYYDETLSVLQQDEKFLEVLRDQMRNLRAPAPKLERRIAHVEQRIARNRQLLGSISRVYQALNGIPLNKAATRSESDIVSMLGRAVQEETLTDDASLQALLKTAATLMESPADLAAWFIKRSPSEQTLLRDAAEKVRKDQNFEKGAEHSGRNSEARRMFALSRRVFGSEGRTAIIRFDIPKLALILGFKEAEKRNLSLRGAREALADLQRRLTAAQAPLNVPGAEAQAVLLQAEFALAEARLAEMETIDLLYKLFALLNIDPASITDEKSLIRELNRMFGLADTGGVAALRALVAELNKLDGAKRNDLAKKIEALINKPSFTGSRSDIARAQAAAAELVLGGLLQTQRTLRTYYESLPAAERETIENRGVSVLYEQAVADRSSVKQMSRKLRWFGRSEVNKARKAHLELYGKLRRSSVANVRAAFSKVYTASIARSDAVLNKLREHQDDPFVRQRMTELGVTDLARLLEIDNDIAMGSFRKLGGAAKARVALVAFQNAKDAAWAAAFEKFNNWRKSRRSYFYENSRIRLPFVKNKARAIKETSEWVKDYDGQSLEMRLKAHVLTGTEDFNRRRLTEIFDALTKDRGGNPQLVQAFKNAKDNSERLAAVCELWMSEENKSFADARALMEQATLKSARLGFFAKDIAQGRIRESEVLRSISVDISDKVLDVARANIQKALDAHNKLGTKDSYVARRMELERRLKEIDSISRERDAGNLRGSDLAAFYKTYAEAKDVTKEEREFRGRVLCDILKASGALKSLKEGWMAEVKENGGALSEEMIIKASAANLALAAIMRGWYRSDTGIFDEQFMATLLAVRGWNAVELATGEGKTLVTAVVSAVNAISGKGSLAVVTKDAAAKDAFDEWHSYWDVLGFTVGMRLNESYKDEAMLSGTKQTSGAMMSPSQIRAAYDADITYVSIQNLAFDYSHDKLQVKAGETSYIEGGRFGRKLPEMSMTIDEMDSVLIDQAMTSFIRAQGGGKLLTGDLLQVRREFAKLVEGMHDVSRDVSEVGLRYAGTDRSGATVKGPQIVVNEDGTHAYAGSRAERAAIDHLRYLADHGQISRAFYDLLVKRKNAAARALAGDEYTELTELGRQYLNNAVQAKWVYRLGSNYWIDNGEVKLISKELGITQQGQRLNELHQAIEARIRVIQEDRALNPAEHDRFTVDPNGKAIPLMEIRAENLTESSVTARDVLLAFGKVSGMSGTLNIGRISTDLRALYGMTCYTIPSHDLNRRVDGFEILMSSRDRLDRAKELIRDAIGNNRSVLINAHTDRERDEIYEQLSGAALGREVKLARFGVDTERSEAALVRAIKENVTILVATNIAGRGTDFKISEEARRAGGLLQINWGINKRFSTDRQASGRSGRSGEMGESYTLLVQGEERFREESGAFL
ncbi:MAG: preprotein translocase subunit SecA [Candidatus Omnitrophica bacterium ADurb.Bin314]|nr:MAG: preprotein translocase subunit SecA [Candidatus Omnitrophica bacterium ADurb.Bin314]